MICSHEYLTKPLLLGLWTVWLFSGPCYGYGYSPIPPHCSVWGPHHYATARTSTYLVLFQHRPTPLVCICYWEKLVSLLALTLLCLTCTLCSVCPAPFRSLRSLRSLSHTVPEIPPWTNTRVCSPAAEHMAPAESLGTRIPTLSFGSWSLCSLFTVTFVFVHCLMFFYCVLQIVSFCEP